MPHDSGNSVSSQRQGTVGHAQGSGVVQGSARPPRAPGNRIVELTVDSAVDRTVVVPDLRGLSLNRARQVPRPGGSPPVQGGLDRSRHHAPWNHPATESECQRPSGFRLSGSREHSAGRAGRGGRTCAGPRRGYYTPSSSRYAPEHRADAVLAIRYFRSRLAIRPRHGPGNNGGARWWRPVPRSHSRSEPAGSWFPMLSG